MSKMNDREKLCNALWATVLWVCVLFYAFAAGVAAGEWEDEPEPVPMECIEVEPVMAAMPFPATETAPAGLDPMVEDTYLRDDVPLSYELQAALYGACLEFEVEYPLALAMLERETQFENTKGDGGNAYGYFQVWPYWHKDRMAELGVTDLMEPEGNFRVAMHFMRELLDRYGNLEDALCYYNSGEPGGNQYSRSVLASVENWRLMLDG